MDEKINNKLAVIQELNSKIVEYHSNSDEVIRAHSKEANQKVSGVIQRRIKSEEKCCDGMLLYEEEQDGDGIKGKYFDNEQWIGAFSERRDDTINFKWNGASPKNGINEHNFSIRWEGFLSAPYGSLYTFAIECDDGATLSINGELVLAHNIQTSANENLLRTETWLNHEVQKRQNSKSNYSRSSSKPIHLTGGTKFK